ncbi:MAG TPA: TetR/AcrR family transcriptional regulator [Streptosporangiaceae bacterium]
MGTQTLSWAASPEPGPPEGPPPAGLPPEGPPPEGPPPEGLRERKKRLMRQQLSDTATRMFMERSFDDVRVAEVAEACGVSEKTVFNYFPTKEALVLDRLEATVTALRDGLADRQVPPIEAALRILDHELAGLTSLLARQDDPGQAAIALRRFGDLIRATPSLRAYQSDMIDQFVSVATEILAARAGTSADDPEPQIAARALLGLWHVQADSLRRHLASSPVTGPVAARVRERVAADVRRAARLIDGGLHAFGAPAPPGEAG